MRTHCTRQDKAPLRILQLVYWVGGGGIESWLLALLENRDPAQLQIDVCCNGPDVGERAPIARQHGGRVIHCPQGIRLLSFVKNLRRVLLNGEYDLLHVHTHVHSGLPVLAARLAGVPVVSTFHNSTHPPETPFTKMIGVRHARELYARASMRYALRRSTLSTAVSEDTLASVHRVTGVKKSHSRVSHLGVVEPRLVSAAAKSALRESIGIHADAPVVMHVGSFTCRKNHSALIKAFRIIHEQLPDAKLVLVGDGPDRGQINQLIEDNRLEDSVRLLGTRRDATELMQVADVLLFPSITEGLSLALMEAHAVGLPVVASNIPGNIEACDGGRLGRLHDPHDVERLAASAVQIIRDPKAAAEMGRESRLYFINEFSFQSSVERLLQIYREALGLETLPSPQSHNPCKPAPNKSLHGSNALATVR